MNIPNLKEEVLEYVLKNLIIGKEGSTAMEFGVYSGQSINKISQHFSQHVYGFDSFEGLPEDWRLHFPKGTFNLNGQLPQVNENVILVKGLFNETLPSFLEKNKHLKEKIELIHLDADLYSSTIYVLEQLFTKGFFKQVQLIVFDEFINYDGYEDGEFKAFFEFINKYNLNYQFIGMNGYIGLNGKIHEAIAIQIIK